MRGLCRCARAAAKHREVARTMFDIVGRTVVVDEKHMDAVTGLSASGPAFAYIILVLIPADRALASAAQRSGRRSYLQPNVSLRGLCSKSSPAVANASN